MADQWQTMLDQQGAVRDEHGLRHFAHQASQSTEPKLFALDHLACLILEGPDAKKFLQGQVTSDINSLSPTLSVTGGHCNTKGRLLFTFRAVLLNNDSASGDKIALLMQRNLRASAQQALAKFIVFSKADLSIDSTYRVLGLAGPKAAQLLSAKLALPSEDNNAASQAGDNAVVRVAGERFLCIAKEALAVPLWQEWSADCELHGYEMWNLADIRDGLGQVQAGTEELFIPQMLNMQLTGGVSFTKGCYVGQEVVARMQYLGKLKRHMRRLQLDSTTRPQPGAPIYTDGSTQSVGNVVLAAATENQGEVLAVTTDDAFANDALYLDQAGQQKLSRLDLPYSID